MRSMKILWIIPIASLIIIYLGLILNCRQLLILSTSSYVLSILASTSISILYLYSIMKHKI
jgi:hypothetical protein